MPYEVGPFDARHYYLQWGGTLPGGDEWSCGLRLASTSPSTAINDPTALAATAAAVEKFHKAAGTGCHSRAVLTFTKLNLIGEDGKYVDPVTYEYVHANVPGGGTSTTPPPQQICLAVSLLTGVSRGPAHRGRFYLPIPVFIAQTDGRISTADQATCKTSATTFLTDLNAVSGNTDVAVFSRKRLAPAHRLVTSMAVGRVLDTQRRRRNKLLEAY